MNFSKITGLSDKMGKVVQIADANGRVLWCHNHSFLLDWVIDIAATCTAAGSKHRVCSSCGQTETETIPAAGHKPGYPAVVRPPTCTVPVEYAVKCTVCNVELDRYEDDGEFAEHIPDGGSVTQKPTCTETGIRQYYCRECSILLKNETIPANGHSWGDNPIEWGDGFAYECTVCGEVDPIEPDECDHASAELVDVIAATCTEGGYTIYACSLCGWVWHDDNTDALGHNHVAVVTAPTCTAKGYTTHTCSRCQDSYTDSYTNIIPHSWSGWTTTIYPDCDDDGSRYRTCSGCGKTETETIEATGHSTTYHPGKDATCTSDGYTGYNQCTECGDIVDGKYRIPAKGHTEVTINGYSATCTLDGKTDGVKCSVCGVTLTAQTTIPALGHRMESDWGVYKAPTCTATGIERRYCSNCNYYESRSIPALGHSYSGKVTPATCTTGGYTTYTCSRCGDSYKSDYTDANGHNYAGGWVTVTPAGCTSSGTEKRVCLTCGNTETRTVPALGHDWEYYPDPTVSSGVSRVCRRCELVEEDV